MNDATEVRFRPIDPYAPCEKCGMPYEKARDSALERGRPFCMGTSVATTDGPAGRWLCWECLAEESGLPKDAPGSLFADG